MSNPFVAPFIYKDNVKIISLNDFCKLNQHLNYISKFETFCLQNVVLIEDKTENDWFYQYHKYLPNIIKVTKIDENEIIKFK